ncbi:MAG: hypothetical protein IPM08_15745 [Actinomycetales bacterium]|nr:hypothetical protein [Actinomycetales bacterium]
MATPQQHLDGIEVAGEPRAVIGVFAAVQTDPMNSPERSCGNRSKIFDDAARSLASSVASTTVLPTTAIASAG